MIRITLENQELELLPQRALLWMERETLILSDPHFGKGASFRRQGVPVPTGGTSQDLMRLARLIDLYCPDRVLILGDLFHTAESQSEETLAALHDWRSLFRHLEIILVRGNHDRHAGDPPAELHFTLLDELVEPPFRFTHLPARDEGGLYTLAGHLHPGLTLTTPGGLALRGPCFYFGRQIGLLPAFGTFTGTAPIQPCEGDRVFLLGPDQVVEIPEQLARRSSTPGAWVHP